MPQQHLCGGEDVIRIERKASGLWFLVERTFLSATTSPVGVCTAFSTSPKLPLPIRSSTCGEPQAHRFSANPYLVSGVSHLVALAPECCRFEMQQRLSTALTVYRENGSSSPPCASTLIPLELRGAPLHPTEATPSSGGGYVSLYHRSMRSAVRERSPSAQVRSVKNLPFLNALHRLHPLSSRVSESAPSACLHGFGPRRAAAAATAERCVRLELGRAAWTCRPAVRTSRRLSASASTLPCTPSNPSGGRGRFIEARRARRTPLRG